MYVRLYAREHPEQVAGMVLVDATHEEQSARLPAAIAKMQATSSRAMGCVFDVFEAMSSIGLLAPLAKVKGGVWFTPVPREARAAYVGTVWSGSKHFEAAKRETLALPESFAAVRARQIQSLGDIPLIVISAGRPAITAGHGISEADAEQFKVLAAELHTEMAALSPRGKRVIAEESGHYVPVDQPQVVVDAIREVVEAARR
jgi:pimeloyl-ACP methyl ester carboxylesterase